MTEQPFTPQPQVPPQPPAGAPPGVSPFLDSEHPDVIMLAGKERTTLHVILFSIITLGIYYLYYLYTNLSDIQRSFRFGEGETTPASVRPRLIAQVIRQALTLVWLPVGMLYAYATGANNAAPLWFQHPAFLVAYALVLATVWFFWAVPYINLVALCQEKSGENPISKPTYFLLSAAAFAIYILSLAVTLKEPLLSITFYTSLALDIYLLWMFVSAINSLWHSPYYD